MPDTQARTAKLSRSWPCRPALRFLFRLSAALILLLSALVAKAGPRTRPKVILLLPVSGSLPTAAVSRAVHAQLRDLSVALEIHATSSPARQASQARKQASVLLVAWLDPLGTLHLRDRKANQPVRRSLPAGSHAVRVAAVALILRSAVAALLDRSLAPRPRPPRTKPGRAPRGPPGRKQTDRRTPLGRRRPRRPWIGLGLAYGLVVFSRDHPTRHEPALALSFRPLRFLSLRLGLAAALPETASDPEVRLETWSLVTSLGLSAFWTFRRIELGGRISILADATFKKVTPQGQAISTDESTDLQWWAQATGFLAFRIWSRLGLNVEAGFRAALSVKRYGAAVTENTTLLAPWPVQPAFSGGLTFWF